MTALYRPMNISNFEHVLYALVIQLAVWLPTRSLWPGAMLVVGLFIGREHAQREYNVEGPAQRTIWEALDAWNWSVDAQLDLILPVAAVVLVAGVTWYVSRKRGQRRPNRNI